MCELLLKKEANLKISIAIEFFFQNLINIGPLIKPEGMEEKFQNNNGRANVYSGL